MLYVLLDDWMSWHIVQFVMKFINPESVNKFLTTKHTEIHGEHKENESKNTQYSFVFSVVIYVTVAT